MRYVLAMAAALVVLSPAIGRADEAEAAPACTPPTRDVVLRLRSLGEEQMTVLGKPLETRQDLALIRSAVSGVGTVATKLRCAYPTLSGKDLADTQAFVDRTEKWVAAMNAALTAEESARTNVVVPMCEAKWSYDNAMAVIAQEKANPSGVVDLRAMHLAGAEAQAAHQQMEALKPAYAAHRKHPFTNWQSEGACVVAASSP